MNVFSTIAGWLDEMLGLSPEQRRLLIRTIWVLIVTTHIAWACGWLAALGLSGFAKASDLQGLMGQMTRIQARQLQTQLLQTRTLHCNAIKHNDATAKGYYASLLQQLGDEYIALTNRSFTLPPCAEM